MITLKVKKLTNTLQKISGLLGKSQPENIFFTTQWGIHTFGMKFPIDVIILNRENQVVRIKKNLQPNKIFLWNPQFDKIVELPEGTIKKEKIELGEKIKVQDSETL